MSDDATKASGMVIIQGGAPFRITECKLTPLPPSEPDPDGGGETVLSLTWIEMPYDDNDGRSENGKRS